jgi:hypothetical protein
VVSLAEVGRGCPDLLVGVGKRTLLMEIKRPRAKGRTAGTLTDYQERWLAEWRGGPVYVVHTPEEALAVLGVEVKAA